MKLEESRVVYLDHMGTDITVVNAARASFGKESDFLAGGVLSKADENLIQFLATGYRTSEWNALVDEVINVSYDILTKDETKRQQLETMLRAYKRKAQHWAPFGHPHVQIRMSLPIFLARQFVKHQIGGVWSEESRRYISDEPGVWMTQEWHTRPEDIKQGSGGTVDDPEYVKHIATCATKNSIGAYEDLLSQGVAPEEARIVLPLNMMTTVVWTGSLLFWSRVCNQRVDSHAQLAAQDLGKKITSVVQPLFPVSWKYLTT